MNKKIIISLCLLVLVSISGGSVLAQSSSPTATGSAQKKAASIADRTADLKLRAAKEIDRRTQSLNQLLGRVNALKKLTADQKATMVSQIQTEITNLGTLKTKIDADTDFVVLQADVKSIVNSYRVYLLFMPKIHMLTAVDLLTDTADKLIAVADKIKTELDSLQAKGKDVASMQTELLDVRAKIQDAKTQAQNVVTALTPLTPIGYPGNKTTLTSARTSLQTARADLKAAYDGIVKIRKEMKALGSTLSSPKAATATSQFHTSP